jgi:hypothetical protein
MKIICIGRNYTEHAKELNNPVPSQPLIFMKPSSALLVDNKPLYYPEFTKDLHYEAEIVLKICKNGKAIQPQFAQNISRRSPSASTLRLATSRINAKPKAIPGRSPKLSTARLP